MSNTAVKTMSTMPAKTLKALRASTACNSFYLLPRNTWKLAATEEIRFLKSLLPRKNKGKA